MKAIKRLGISSAALLLAVFTCTVSRSAFSGVQQTGQTDCWDESGNSISCSGTGQDGELQKGASTAARFIDNGDGTVTDKLTNLIWLKEASCFERMKWADALSTVSSLSAGCCCGLADGSVAGDWRMPNIKELQSLVDYGQFSPAFPLVHPFTGVKAGHYWSSTTMKGNPDRAFSLYLSFGVAGRNLKRFEDFLIWPVRDGP